MHALCLARQYAEQLRGEAEDEEEEEATKSTLPEWLEDIFVYIIRKASMHSSVARAQLYKRLPLTMSDPLLPASHPFPVAHVYML